MKIDAPALPPGTLTHHQERCRCGHTVSAMTPGALLAALRDHLAFGMAQAELKAETAALLFPEGQATICLK